MDSPMAGSWAVKPKAEPAVGADGGHFAWSSCSDNKDIRSRVLVKQRAVDDALRDALKLCEELRAPGKVDPSSPDESLEQGCGKELVEWMDRFVFHYKLHKTHQAFEILIGVAGRTGAGKSTILNMPLEFPELLPSSNSEAATSCACRVSWNCDDAPDRKFRAEVTFRSYDDVKQEIQHIFALLRERFKKIRAVWGLDEEAVEDVSVQDLLQSNPDVLQLLGTTQIIYSVDTERFAEQVKPFLDSSETVQGFKAWPLITEVRLFSRARVAEKFAQKLEITAIVRPARRAIDEKTGVQLMSEYQTLRMQLDGKYHKKSFCVVVSQIDEIDCDVFIKGHPTTKQDQNLLNDTKEIDVLTKESTNHGKYLKDAEKELKRIEDKLTAAENTLAALKVTGAGSQKIKQPIGRDFAQRQKALAREMGRGNVYDGSVDAIPVSATAFSDHLKGRDPMELGFPTERHTGIPRLRQWLVDSTLERREKHLDVLLNSLRRLFLSIQSWSNAFCGTQTLVFSRDSIEDLLSRIHAKFLKVRPTLRANVVKTLDPFKQGPEGRAVCKVACKAATRWALKTPEDKRSAVRMHWVTFDAILKRKGGPYRSTGKQKTDYNFPVAMRQIPSAEQPIMQGIEMIKATAPNIMPHFEESMLIIRGIKSEMRDKVNAALGRLSDCSSEIHPEFLGELREELGPIFETTLKYEGTGHFEDRRRYLYDTVKNLSEDMYQAGHEKMVTKYAENLGKLPRDFDELASFAVSKVAAQITLLLDNLEGVGGKDWAVAGMEATLQQRLQTTIMQWQMDWKLPKLDKPPIKCEDVEIPEGFDEGREQVVIKEEPKVG
ncbi:hypothetical protein C8A03DRAFT_41106 [Achaetomium macrosporum]|uniref:Uncharacterized protein n=1 Tax=Achaetomium macrosporum TaxID=79813 RepID=A0AAN7CIK9_9PEZI|nr:hypothetical protein C8A03DRAFT_41106 [Achaetomium macrosporum]